MLKNSFQKMSRAALVLGLLAGWAGLSGCESQHMASHAAPVPSQNSSAAASSSATASAAAPAAPAADNSPSLTLREGDAGAPSLDTTQVIRRDGKITLEMVGELKAAGLTAKELEQQLLKAYDSQLVVKEVSVVVQSSVFIVYVTGTVMRPGKVISDHVETPLEVLIEAGIDHEKANLKKVVVVRENENGKTERFTLNLDDVLKGKQTQPFTLKQLDTIYVPEKFTWF